MVSGGGGIGAQAAVGVTKEAAQDSAFIHPFGKDVDEHNSKSFFRFS